MKTFEQMWKEAKEIGDDTKALAENFYNTFKDKISETEMQCVIEVLSEIDGMQNYLLNEKVEKAELNQVKMTLSKNLKEHAHLDGKVVTPLE